METAQPTIETSGTGRIERSATGIRILLTLLFTIIIHVIEVLLTVVILFELAVALVTQRPPNQKTRSFANQVVTYLYRVTRYLTYNEAEPPFPFTDFPEELEPPSDAYDEAETLSEGDALHRTV